MVNTAAEGNLNPLILPSLSHIKIPSKDCPPSCLIYGLELEKNKMPDASSHHSLYLYFNPKAAF